MADLADLEIENVLSAYTAATEEPMTCPDLEYYNRVEIDKGAPALVFSYQENDQPGTRVLVLPLTAYDYVDMSDEGVQYSVARDIRLAGAKVDEETLFWATWLVLDLLAAEEADKELNSYREFVAERKLVLAGIL